MRELSTGPAPGALEELDALLALGEGAALDAAGCLRMAVLVEQVPGRLGRVVRQLKSQRDAAAVEALLALPEGTRGVVEGLFAALRGGVSRAPSAASGRASAPACPRMLALEFRSSRSRRFPALLERALAAFGEELERLRIDDALHYRIALFEGDDLRRRARLQALDLERLHRDLLRLRGVRLWLNGWRFDDRRPPRPAARVPLVRAWLDWALEAEP